MSEAKTLLVTNALPYANGPVHLGHMLEHIQSDIYVRFQRELGRTVYYVCGDDCHGTPVMIKAAQLGLTPEEMIERARKSHLDDLRGFLIDYDNYYKTHSPENEEISCRIYLESEKKGFIVRKKISQLYDPEKRMFLPDRFVKGVCPKCGARDQYGDNCEVCGATYAPTDLKEPYSTVSGARPELRDSLHYFFDLPKAEGFLHDFIRNRGVIPPEMAHKLEEWFTQGLRPWDISRDAPYFGFRIPGTEDKYFYVWLDAPIGYLASLKNYLEARGRDFEPFVREDADVEMVHFIGKDILYFHSLFWPATLHAAGMHLPDRIFVHGYVTVNGAKMSKSKGTFIKAATFLKFLRPETLRYYFASKLNSSAVDLDLALDDFVARVNSDIVGKLVNLASRTAGFISRRFDGMLAAECQNAELVRRAGGLKDVIVKAYGSLNYADAVRAVMAFADEANRYIDHEAPWVLAKQSGQSERLQRVCTDGLNLFRALIIYLKPILPELCRNAAEFLNAPLEFSQAAVPLLSHRINPFRPLFSRVDPRTVEELIAASREDLRQAAAPAAPGGGRPEAAPPEPLAPEIGIEDFLKVDLRVATILKAEEVPGSSKLLRLTVDLGFETRVVFAGIKAAYPDPAALAGRRVIVAANLRPRAMRFGVSEGMITAAGEGGERVFLLSVDEGARNGERVH